MQLYFADFFSKALCHIHQSFFRMIRFKVRMGYQIAERTQLQYENARLAEVEKHITPAQLLAELEAIANEPSIGDILQALDETKLLTLIFPVLTAPASSRP